MVVVVCSQATNNGRTSLLLRLVVALLVEV